MMRAHRNTACFIRRVARQSRDFIAATVCLLATSLMSPLLLADSTAFSGPPLKPFTAEFKVSLNRLPTLARASLYLVREAEPDTWSMHFQGKHYLGRTQESATFRWQQCAGTPLQHHFRAQSVKVRDERSSTFDWESGLVHVVDDDFGELELPLNEKIYDEVSIYLAIRCEVAKGRKDLAFKVLRGDKIRTVEYRVVDKARVRTSLGKLDTIVLEKVRDDSARKTLIWIAPELEYMLVKLKHIENFALQGEIELKEFQIGDPILPESLFNEADPEADANMTSPEGSDNDDGASNLLER